MLPVIHPSLPAVATPRFAPGSTLIQNSNEKSVAPTSTGRAGLSSGIRTRSIRPVPLPKKRNDPFPKANDGREITIHSQLLEQQRSDRMMHS
jgi:hypothetical protein